MKKFMAIILYTIVLLLVGRNLTFIPLLPLLEKPTPSQEDIKKEVETIVHKQKGNYSVLFVDFSTDTSFGINDEEIFTAASVNKVPIVTTLYFLANKNKIDLDETITLQAVDIEDYGTGRLRYEKPGGVYSLKTLAKLALQQSDNTAAKLISTRIGNDTIQDTIDDWGLTQTDMEKNKTSLADMALLFEKIHTNEVTTPGQTKELLEFMSDTDFEDRIPHLLPPESKTYHKSGDAVGNVHDVGIVTYNGKTFFIGILTSEVGNQEKETKGAIAAIAKRLFDFAQTIE